MAHPNSTFLPPSTDILSKFLFQSFLRYVLAPRTSFSAGPSLTLVRLTPQFLHLHSSRTLRKILPFHTPMPPASPELESNALFNGQENKYRCRHPIVGTPAPIPTAFCYLTTYRKGYPAASPPPSITSVYIPSIRSPSAIRTSASCLAFSWRSSTAPSSKTTERERTADALPGMY